MTPGQIERVFGRGRLKMMTGEHVEVYREAVGPGERRRYTKRFLDTGEGDFGQWTEREWRLLARLIGHGIRCVPDVVQFDGGAQGGVRLVQTYDAGVTVDQWATLMPVSRNGIVQRHVFEDCAHWWALAHHCLAALDEIHRLQLVHLDVKGDNICIPFGPANFDPEQTDVRLYPIFSRLALIDFAFSLVSHENLAAPLPIGWQKDYDYQSPRLLAALEAGRNGDMEPTRELDWRCDLYSLAAMLKRYLPDEARAQESELASGWSAARYNDAKTLIFRIRDAHDRDFPHWRPHSQLMEMTAARLRESDLAASLDYGWTLARDATIDTAAAALTPMTRIAPSLRTVERSPLITRVVGPTAVTVIASPPRIAPRPPRRRALHAVALSALAVAAIAAPSFIGDPQHPIDEPLRAIVDSLQPRVAPSAIESKVAQSEPSDTKPAETPVARSDAEPKPSEATDTSASTPAPAPGATAPSQAAAPAQPQTPVGNATPVPHRGGAVSLAPPPKSRAAAAPARSPTLARSAPPRAPHPKYPMPPPPSVAALKGNLSKPLVLAHSTPRAAAHPAAAPKSATAAPTKLAAATPIPTPSVDSTSIATASDMPRADPPATTPAVAPTQPVASNDAPVQSAPSQASASPSPTTDNRTAVQPKSTAPAKVAAKPPRRDDSSDPIGALLRSLRGRDQPPAPIEERVAQAPTAPIAATPRAIPPPAPRASPPTQLAESRATPPPSVVDDFTAQARRALADAVPRVATQAQSDIARVLWIAAGASHPSQEWAVVDAARSTWSSERVPIAVTSTAPTDARRLQDDARHAFASGGNVSSAITSQLRAFGADPRDADVASYLAFLQLRATPPQPEAARELALYALALRGPRRTTRVDDWQTFAIASALAGRDNDARHAFFASIALAKNADRSCRTALAAYANYGERLRAPVEAALYRMHLQGRDYESPYCAWPPDWNAVSRWP